MVTLSVAVSPPIANLLLAVPVTRSTSGTLLAQTLKLIKTLIGHTGNISSPIFPSSLISASRDNTIKFWQIGTPSTDPVTIDIKYPPPTPPSIESVSMQVRDGVAISSDGAGVVKTWDILTGLCKASF